MINVNYISAAPIKFASMLYKPLFFNKKFVYYINRHSVYDKIEVVFYMCNSYSFYKIKTNDDLYNYIFNKGSK